MLRKQYKVHLRRFFSKEIGRCRIRKGLTQEQFAERLCMDPRSYADLEHGESGCSCLTVILFLVQLSDEEILLAVHGVKKVLEEAARHAVA